MGKSKDEDDSFDTGLLTISGLCVEPMHAKVPVSTVGHLLEAASRVVSRLRIPSHLHPHMAIRNARTAGNVNVRPDMLGANCTGNPTQILRTFELTKHLQV